MSPVSNSTPTHTQAVHTTPVSTPARSEASICTIFKVGSTCTKRKARKRAECSLKTSKLSDYMTEVSQHSSIQHHSAAEDTYTDVFHSSAITQRECELFSKDDQISLSCAAPDPTRVATVSVNESTTTLADKPAISSSTTARKHDCPTATKPAESSFDSTSSTPSRLPCQSQINAPVMHTSLITSIDRELDTGNIGLGDETTSSSDICYDFDV